MKKNIICLALALSYAGASFNVCAEQSGTGSRYDRRIQSVMYNPDQVYRVNTYVGRATSIQLSPEESIKNVDGIFATGDQKAWDMGINGAGNKVVFKPVAEMPDTNLIISTNLRTYIFELVTSKSPENVTYLLRFNYPAPKRTPESPFTGYSLNKNPCAGSYQNTNYYGYGDKALTPFKVWDNGRFTCFKFDPSKDLPQVYAVRSDGKEYQINPSKDNDVYVVHETSTKFVIRMDDLALGVINKSPRNLGYNYSGTTNGNWLEVRK
ncbi:TrbG/VirB9 family P-type conjugative transfer protein [Enterobacter hormaechei]|uniref:TrbG/VirB9 family P-type conjugative transfer protein n=1 Tax=Enterobacter hormaechei TaxID=158836 RepID=UPI0020B8821C|nr:TrbG/VirB9 family P-type conjugative transfer protein [Enterobacter hormaechei]UTI09414.1 TrbG/VirB9 family P-type conjugative transfer protein [Enterobacter hormaechei subsp. steigerwaltii]